MIEDIDKEARDLVSGNVARTTDEARERIRRANEQRQKSNTLIFYDDYRKVRNFFSELLDEEVYKGEIRSAKLPDGSLGRLRRNGDNGLVLAALKEFVPRDGENPRIVAFAKGFSYDNKTGLFFTPWSLEELRKQGKTPYDEKRCLHRIEFAQEYQEQQDHITAMFSAWKDHPLSESHSLVLYIPKGEVVRFS